MQAIMVNTFGGSDVLQLEDVAIPTPQPGEVRVRVVAAGVNFIDVYNRSGAYKNTLPLTPGHEGAGIVDAVGPDVSSIQEGDRVAWAMVMGAYADYAIVPAAKLVRVPETIELDTAAAVMLQGMTAHYLCTSTFPVEAGQQVLVHAAAGGVGLLLVQLAKHRGAYVIGTVGTEEKAALAKDAGADAVILYRDQDFVAETRRLTNGTGVHVVYDSVGKTTFTDSLDALRPRGYMVLFGQSSGAVPPFDPQILNSKGSLFVTRPTLGNYIADRSELEWRASELFDLISAGSLRIRIDRRLPLADARAAHDALESRATAGKLLLIPGASA